MFFSSFQTDTKLKARQAILYSSSIKQEILKDLKKILKLQSQKSKILAIQGKKNEKELRNFKENLEKVLFFDFFLKKFFY